MTEPVHAGTLTGQAESFAADLDDLLSCCLPDAPRTAVSHRENRVQITGDAPLTVKSQALATLHVSMLCQLDHLNLWLAIDKSDVTVTSLLDREPLIRFDYLRVPDWCPSSHVQIHAHRGAFSHLLALTGHKKPHQISSLHIPTGGSRFRPGVEDVLQFLIEDCRFDGADGWRAAVERHRTEFRRKQLRAAVRAMPRDAAEALEAKGYQVVPPDGGHPDDKPDALTGW
jgi:hypothetical protein